MTGPNLLAWAKRIVAAEYASLSVVYELARAILADEEERKRNSYYQIGDKLVDVDGQVWVIAFIDDEEFALELEKSKWNDDGSITIGGGILGSPLSELKKYRKLAEPPSE